jgi:hypothetical protein
MKLVDVGIFRLQKSAVVGLLGSETFGGFLKFLSPPLVTSFAKDLVTLSSKHN